jgi:hypothetical protein
MGKAGRIDAIKKWEQYRNNLIRETPVPIETESEKAKRIAHLEKHPEEWFQFYFPNYYKASPAKFHIASTKRILGNAEWYEVRAWSRELAKSTRSMMEFLYLLLTKKKRYMFMASNSYDNAVRLTTPYKIQLESNRRIINDYGPQASLGNWTDGDFTTRSGFTIRSIGAGQSPRGARNEEIRPDIICFDDFDTDEECLNSDIIDKKWKWCTEALLPTRSISEATLVVWCGNLIAEDCCIMRAQEFADKVDVVNIRDREGRSSWPAKNTEAHIDRVLSTLPYSAQQKEYYNNPVNEGKVFKEMTWGKCPPLKSMDLICVYSDPSTSNRDKPSARSKHQNSTKAVVIVGKKGLRYYIYKAWVDVVKNSVFVDWLYQAKKELPENVQDYIYIENNTLQAPFYEQVLLPLIKEKGKQEGRILNVQGDGRNKPDKYFRIEGNLEPINRMGLLILNSDEKDNPHMKRLEAQFKSVSPNSKTMDGPDAVEGAKWILDNKALVFSIRLGAQRNPARKKY